METFLEEYGYLAVVAGTFIEGEAALLAGAFMANQGYLTFVGVVLAAMAGSQITDWMYFLLGRTKGTQLLNKRPAWKQKTLKVNQFVEKYPIAILFLYRFMYGFRTVIPLVIGLSSISVWRFWLIGMLGTICWSLSFATLGFWLGKAVDQYLAQLNTYKWPLLVGAAVLVAFIAWGINWKKRKTAAVEYDRI